MRLTFVSNNVRGTGNGVPTVVRQHVGTVTSSNGIVWHVLEASHGT